jgi:ABC-2 type transport system ATP-binding protein
VVETVRIVAALHGHEDRVVEVMERTGLTPLARRKVKVLSGGEQQRLKFALALLPDPDLLVLDEPTAGMDAAARRDFWETMRAETGNGRTIIFATHYLEEAQAFAPRTVLINKGVVVADRPTDELREAMGDRIVRATFETGFAAPTGDLGETASDDGAAASDRDADAVTDRVGAVRLGYDVGHVRDMVAAMPGVRDAWVEEFAGGARLAATAGDSDAVARYLLNETAAVDLEVSAPSLESAFFALTEEGPK